VVLGVIAAAMSLATATLNALSASPSPTTVVVIYAPSHCGATPGQGQSGAPPKRDAG